MGKLVVIRLGDGSFEEGKGFPVTLEFGEDGKRYEHLRQAWLPGKSELDKLYQNVRKHGFKGSLKDKYKPSSELFKTLLSSWLESPEFLSKWVEVLGYCNRCDKIRVVLQAKDLDIPKLPWHFWSFFDSYTQAEISFSIPEYTGFEPTAIKRNYVRILAILGDSKNIDITKDEAELKQVSPETCFLAEQSQTIINEHLWDEQGWDILFFAGHSKTEGNTGIIYINSQDSISIDSLEYALKEAIYKKGLKLAIFNSCDGLGIACQLVKWNIPQAIVMREPVPDFIAQEFLKYFLAAYSRNNQTLYLAFQEARKKLQGWEGQYPYASWLPVIYQNPYFVPPTWEELCSSHETTTTNTVFPFQIWKDLESTNPEIFKKAAEEKLLHRLKELSLSNQTLILDTSNITCAEYQLFIYEKQKIGENHQPDHWESYRFIPGNSIKPIVGVRASDAEEFCQWLNEQYCQPGQKYRLPLQDEVEKYLAVNQQIGCWCTTEKNYEIIGIEPKQLQNLQQKILQLIESGRTPENYNNYLHLALINLGIDYRQSSQLANNINLKGITEIALQHEPNLNHLISPELPLKITLSQSLSDEFDLKLSSANEIAHTCNINLNGDLKHIPDFSLRSILEKIAPKIDEALLQEIKRECKRELSEFKTDFNSRRTCYYLLLIYALWQLLSAIYKEAYQDSDFIKLLTRWRKSEKRLSDKYAKLRDKAFNLYILFLLLYERRKGNLPAWEGIRIVRAKIE